MRAAPLRGAGNCRHRPHRPSAKRPRAGGDSGRSPPEGAGTARPAPTGPQPLSSAHPRPKGPPSSGRGHSQRGGEARRPVRRPWGRARGRRGGTSGPCGGDEEHGGAYRVVVEPPSRSAPAAPPAPARSPPRPHRRLPHRLHLLHLLRSSPAAWLRSLSATSRCSSSACRAACAASSAPIEAAGSAGGRQLLGGGRPSTAQQLRVERGTGGVDPGRGPGRDDPRSSSGRGRSRQGRRGSRMRVAVTGGEATRVRSPLSHVPGATETAVAGGGVGGSLEGAATR